MAVPNTQPSCRLHGRANLGANGSTTGQTSVTCPKDSFMPDKVHLMIPAANLSSNELVPRRQYANIPAHVTLPYDKRLLI